MNKEPLQATARDACGRADTTSTRRPERGAWLIRAAAVVYLIATAIIAYCVLSAV